MIYEKITQARCYLVATLSKPHSISGVLPRHHSTSLRLPHATNAGWRK